MRSTLDKILLGLLWLLAATLATSFWFNSAFGFNIFAVPHWQYLAYLQAAHTPVRPAFYISLAIALFITVNGLYLVVQPRFRRISLPVRDTTPPQPTQPTQQPETRPTPVATQAHTPVAPATPNISENAVQNKTHGPKPEQAPAPIPMVPLRPPRLNLATTNSYASATTATAPAPKKSAPSQDSPELRQIFTDAGYTVKNAPFITGFKPALFAIGLNETLWIGAIGVETTTLRRAIDKLNEVFTDTLDDIYININGFVVNAPDADTTNQEDILLFSDISDVQEYMSERTNPKPDTEEQENFDAYSEYIDTVIGYIGKL